MREIPDSTQRVLDAAERKGVKLDVTFFDESTHTAADAARAVGAELGQIVKSLVFVSESDVNELQPCLVLASGANTVDVEMLRAVLTEPRIRRATAQEAHDLTGFAIGGIPPFGHRQQIRTIMDPDLGRYATIWAAAGTANAVFPVAPNTLRILANAVVTPIAPSRIGVEREQPASASSNA
jgi:prolyl-tRNA editing enzyme YbaK/EbsC (Cys-tRNA(Pro) deacylase)